MFLVCFFYSFFAVPAFAQRKTLISAEFFESPVANANRSVNDLCTDSRGTVWIATNSGLLYFDGTEIQQFNCSNKIFSFSQPILSVLEDSDANLWVSTSEGLKILAPDRFNLIPASRLGIPDSIAKYPNLLFCKGQSGAVLLAAEGNLFEFRNKKLILKYVFEKTQNLLYFTLEFDPHNKLIFYNDNKNFRVINEHGSVILNPPVLDTIDGRVYEQSTSGVHVSGFNLDTNTLTLTISTNLIAHRFIEFDPQSNCFASKNKFQEWDLSTIEYRGNFSKNTAETAALPKLGKKYEPWVAYLINHSTWLVVVDDGFLIASKITTRFKYLPGTSSNIVRAIHMDRFGHVIFAANNALLWKTFPNGKPHVISSGVNCWAIRAVTPENDYFVAEGEDLSKRWYILKSSPTEVRLEKLLPFNLQGAPRSYSMDMALDTQRHAIFHVHNSIARYSNLFFFDLKTQKNYTIATVQADRPIRCMEVGRDLWLAGASGIMSFRITDNYPPSLVDCSEELPEEIRKLHVNDLLLNKNESLWISTDDQGVIRYHIPSKQVERFSTEDGLASNCTYSILLEKDRPVAWIGTAKGLSRLNIPQKSFSSWFIGDGLNDNEFNTAAAYQTPDGTLFFGGPNGFSYCNPADFNDQTFTAKQYAIITLNRQLQQAQQERYFVNSGDVITVDPDVQLLEFNFRCDIFSKGDDVQFRYNIPQITDNWQYFSSTERVLFPHLPSGKYQIQVQVKPLNGSWMPASIYLLNVIPPWYATWWFRTLVLLGIAGLLYGLYLLRIRYLRREFALRQQISHDLHDDLGSRIFLLRTLSHKIANPLLSDADKQAHLDHFEATSQETFKSIRDFIWAFDPKQDDAQQLFDRMDDFAENYLLPIISDVHIHRSNVQEGIKIGPRVKHHLMNIYQELLTNMVKHTQSEVMDIFLSVDSSTLTVEIRNQHKGYQGANPQQADIKLGQESLQNRLAEINAKLVWDEPNEHLQTAKISVAI